MPAGLYACPSCDELVEQYGSECADLSSERMVARNERGLFLHVLARLKRVASAVARRSTSGSGAWPHELAIQVDELGQIMELIADSGLADTVPRERLADFASEIDDLYGSILLRLHDQLELDQDARLTERARLVFGTAPQAATRRRLADLVGAPASVSSQMTDGRQWLPWSAPLIEDSAFQGPMSTSYRLMDRAPLRVEALRVSPKLRVPRA